MTSLVERLRERLLASSVEASRTNILAGDWDFDVGGTDAGTALKPAAVLVPLVDRAEPGLILTRRNASLRQHPGQVAFPGGRIDPEDAGPEAAALREAWEEIGLQPASVRVLGRASSYETGTGYSIAPIVGLIAPDTPMTPSADEVEALFEVPLAFVLDPANHQLRRSEWRGRDRQYYVIEHGPWSIWGATAGILVNLSRLLR